MIWNKLKKIFGVTSNESAGSLKATAPKPDSSKEAFEKGISSEAKTSSPKMEWLDANSNPWHVPVLDVRPFTLSMLSTTLDPQLAANAVSYANDDGEGFIDQDPVVDRIIPSGLAYPIDRFLSNGVLFLPRQMEHKWAIFYREGKIIFVRSWQRQVFVVARTELRGELLAVTEVHGAFGGAGEDAEFTLRTLDFLIRTHALNEPYPAPLPQGIENDVDSAARWCFSAFGNMVQCATHHHIEFQLPQVPLRTHSLLHIAVAHADREKVAELLKSGVPADLLAGDGLAPLHWALAQTNLPIMEMLIAAGSPVDVRSAEGATPLMNAAQGNNLEALSFLLEQGAKANNQDQRGFTALHRAAEMGHLDVAKALVNAGASPVIEAQGHTPRSLAEMRGLAAMIEVLSTTP